jgi:hypothetical protein
MATLFLLERRTPSIGDLALARGGPPDSRRFTQGRQNRNVVAISSAKKR